YEYVRSPDGLWGVPDRNNSWSGMLGMLQREEVEIALGPFGVTYQREQVCDFSVPVYIGQNKIMMQRPRLMNDVSGFIKPFTPTLRNLQVWGLVMLSLVVVCLAFAFVVWKEGQLTGRPARNVLSKAMIWVLKALTQESCEHLPKTNGGRVVVSTWLLASLVFMSSYSGILTAMITVPRVHVPIDSVEDLVNQRDMPWRIEAGSMMFQYFQAATGGAKKAVFDHRAGEFHDCWEDRQPIANGEFAAICDDITMMKAMSWDFSTTGECHLYITREAIFDVAIALAYKSNSAYKERVNFWIHRVTEAGIFNKWLQLEIRNTSQCLQPPSALRSGITVSGLTLDAFIGCLLLLAGGKQRP
ncbi:hypothetical protein Pcinc_022885, partial [Petrolisthes cinctipes]